MAKWDEQTLAELQKDKAALEEQMRDLLRDFADKWSYWVSFEDQPLRVRWDQCLHNVVGTVKLMLVLSSRLF